MFEVDKIQYSLDFRIIEGDVGLPQNSFRTSDFLPHGMSHLCKRFFNNIFPPHFF